MASSEATTFFPFLTILKVIFDKNVTKVLTFDVSEFQSSPVVGFSVQTLEGPIRCQL